jgi:hypothetical protein
MPLSQTYHIRLSSITVVNRPYKIFEYWSQGVSKNKIGIPT